MPWEFMVINEKMTQQMNLLLSEAPVSRNFMKKVNTTSQYMYEIAYNATIC